MNLETRMADKGCLSLVEIECAPRKTFVFDYPSIPRPVIMAIPEPTPYNCPVMAIPQPAPMPNSIVAAAPAMAIGPESPTFSDWDIDYINGDGGDKHSGGDRYSEIECSRPKMPAYTSFFRPRPPCLILNKRKSIDLMLKPEGPNILNKDKTGACFYDWNIGLFGYLLSLSPQLVSRPLGSGTPRRSFSNTSINCGPIFGPLEIPYKPGPIAHKPGSIGLPHDPEGPLGLSHDTKALYPKSIKFRKKGMGD